MNSGSGPLISIVDNVQLKCGHKTPSLVDDLWRCLLLEKFS